MWAPLGTRQKEEGAQALEVNMAVRVISMRLARLLCYCLVDIIWHWLATTAATNALYDSLTEQKGQDSVGSQELQLYICMNRKYSTRLHRALKRKA